LYRTDVSREWRRISVERGSGSCSALLLDLFAAGIVSLGAIGRISRLLRLFGL